MADKPSCESAVLCGLLFRPDWTQEHRHLLAPTLFRASRTRMSIASVALAMLADGLVVNPAIVMDRLYADPELDRGEVIREWREAREFCVHANERVTEALADLRREEDRLELQQQVQAALNRLDSSLRDSLDEIVATAERFRSRAIDPLRPTDATRAFLDAGRSKLEIKPIPLSELGEPSPIDFLWQGYLAGGFLTLFTGLWKAGKTTLLSHLYRAMGEGGEVGGLVKPGKVLVISEEHSALWRQRRDALQIEDHVHLLTFPHNTRPNEEVWFQFIVELAAKVKTEQYVLVVFDTIASIWPVRDENKSAEVLSALMPLRILARAGCAVLLVHHPRKGDGDEGQASRGSGALTGAVDIIMEMRRFARESRSDTRRVLSSYSRFSETPLEQVIELTEAGYSVVGTKADATQADRAKVIETILAKADEGVSLVASEILKHWPTDSVAAPSKRTLEEDLARGLKTSMWARSGAGARGDPYQWKRFAPPNTPKGARNDFTTDNNLGPASPAPADADDQSLPLPAAKAQRTATHLAA